MTGPAGWRLAEMRCPRRHTVGEVYGDGEDMHLVPTKHRQRSRSLSGAGPFGAYCPTCRREYVGDLTEARASASAGRYYLLARASR